MVLQTVAAATTGKVGFWLPTLEFLESRLYGHFIVLRSGGFDGNITVTYQILNGTNATADVDFAINPAPMIFIGDTNSVQSQMMIFMNNNVWEPDKVIKLRLVAEPPEALDESLATLDVWIRDDGDAGRFLVPHMTWVSETSLESEAISYNISNESCATWISRDGLSSGIAGLQVELQNCAVAIPEVRDHATYVKDFLYNEQSEPLIWEDGESGRKCAVALLTQEAVEAIIFQGFIPPTDRIWIWINADGKLERDEGLCFGLTVTNGSAAVQEQNFAVLLYDSGLDGGGRIRCVRGLDCVMDMSNSSALMYQYGFVQPSVEGANCLPCDEAYGYGDSSANLSSDMISSFNLTGSATNLLANLGMSLKEFTPGTYSVCLCGIGINGQVATMTLSGPRLRNTGFCAMSWPHCALEYWDAVNPAIGHDHLQIMTDCDRPDLTPEGFRLGGNTVLALTGFAMRNTSEMRTAENGIYVLCYCYETATQKCDQLEQFKAGAGTFIYIGPNRLPPMTSMLGQSFQVSNVFGTRLTDEDKVMLLPQCGVPHGQPFLDSLNATFDFNNSRFNFGILREEDGFLAMDYQLCWCQPADGRFGGPVIACDEPQHFLAHIGTVRLICSFRYVDLDGHGHCRQCPLMIQTAGGPRGEECVIAVDLFVMAFSWLTLMTLFFLAIFSSFRCSRHGVMKLHGMPRKVEDICNERDHLLITTCGFHNLIKLKRHPIPVFLQGTGHFLLDSKPEKPIQLYVMPVNELILEVVDKDGKPVSFQADSSMGQVEVPFFRTLIHSALPDCSLPLLLQLILLLGGSVALGIYLLPSPQELAIYVLLAIVLVLLGLLIWKQLIRNSTSLSRRLKAYAAYRAKDDKRKTKEAARGKDRGIRVWKILDLYEHFNAHIRNRNMYYLDPNIVRPLTAGVKLSFSELIGPDQVEWFVSHWWGTSVATYCSALKRHAYEVKVKESGGTSRDTFTSAMAKGDQSWSNTTYWICTFSNNQYKIAEELGGGEHTESSFYKALHSDGLKGTCMILDEMTMPLMRSWCLFELLQTIELEEKSQKEMRPFGGLLFCTSVGVLNYGSSTVEMSMKIGERLLTLSLRDAQATTDKDKQMIADLVQSSRGSFDEIDTTLRVHIRDALKACHQQVNTDFTSLFGRLPHDDTQTETTL